MSVSISELMSTLQNGVQAINNVSEQLASIFPQAAALSTTAPSTGSVTFNSSQAMTFLSVMTSSGATFKVALY